MCAEMVGGYLANSLALMTDAAHLLSDLASFCISLFAVVRALHVYLALAVLAFAHL